MQQIPDRRKYMNELIKKESMKLGVELSDRQAEQFALYYEMLIKKNEQVNLTAITEKEDVAVKHFADSLGLVFLKDNPCVKRMLSGEGIKIIDIGTGAGFPGIPLKIAFPNVNVTLLDSLNKRVVFLDEVITGLKLEKIKAIHSRAEDQAAPGKLRETFDIVVSRAVANMSTLSEYCIPYVKKGGYFIAYKSGEFAKGEERQASEKAIKVFGGSLETVYEYTLPDTDYFRCLAAVKKVQPTPKKYPRKAGLPSKEPIC